MADSNNTTYRARITLDMTDKNQKDAAALLKCAGRNKHKLITIMASEIMETYGIAAQDISKETVKTFINSYSYIKSMREVKMPIRTIMAAPPPQSSRETTSLTREEEPVMSTVDIKQEDATEDTDIDITTAKQALKAFGI